MKEPGYLAIPAREAVHIVKCIPTTVIFRKTDECYNELPITLNNRSAFLKPRTHIITASGSARRCNELLRTLFKINSRWYKLTPQLSETINPPAPDPFATPRWHYEEPLSLATGGVYSEDEIENLREHIMFPVEKHSVLDNFAQGMNGNENARASLNIGNFLTETDIQRLTKSMAKKIWDRFFQIGTITSGFLGIFLIIRIIKLIINIILEGITLHQGYGWSVHLMAAVWTTLTNYIIRDRQEQKPSGSDEDAEVELNTVNPSARLVIPSPQRHTIKTFKKTTSPTRNNPAVTSTQLQKSGGFLFPREGRCDVARTS
ncbi:hypothetical protein WN48_06373 [Eufriesea mexicana]|uniref:Uncharacterized protein n=1 Tax=Eufriesea mexicana TaxID=516756 RepID=A0A310SBN3_9HYME|nr:hypothetical protein WN48_06373 [Eufriesea mexicana]